MVGDNGPSIIGVVSHSSNSSVLELIAPLGQSAEPKRRA
jgi:hypothetical protein